jgi:hypothetical protein
MKIGYARASTDDQNPALQLASANGFVGVCPVAIAASRSLAQAAEITGEAAIRVELLDLKTRSRSEVCREPSTVIARKLDGRDCLRPAELSEVYRIRVSTGGAAGGTLPIMTFPGDMDGYRNQIAVGPGLFYGVVTIGIKFGFVCSRLFYRTSLLFVTATRYRATITPP